MKRIRYSKYVPDPASEMSMEDLLSALSDYFLQSGFNDNFWYELPEGEQTLDELRRALAQALLDGEMFDEEMRDRLQQMQMDGELEELIEKLIERMQQELKGMEAAAVLAVSDAHWKTKMNGLRNSVSRQSWRGTFRQPRQLRDRRQDNHP